MGLDHLVVTRYVVRNRVERDSNKAIDDSVLKKCVVVECNQAYLFALNSLSFDLVQHGLIICDTLSDLICPIGLTSCKHEVQIVPNRNQLGPSRRMPSLFALEFF